MLLNFFSENHPFNNIKESEKSLFSHYIAENDLQYTNLVRYLDEDPISDCYFAGIHLDNFTDSKIYLDYSVDANDNENFLLNGESFDSFTNNCIYYINTDSGYLINNYESLNKAGILTTYPHETVSQGQNVQLLV